jgi:hypothetical protein
MTRITSANHGDTVLVQGVGINLRDTVIEQKDEKLFSGEGA